MSYKGLVGIIVIFILCVIIVFVEAGVLIVISQKQYFNQEVDVLNSLLFVLKRVPKLFGLSIFQIVPFFMLIILPLNLNFMKIIQEKINLPILITSQLNGSKIYLILNIIILFLCIYLFIRSIFTIHFIVIKGLKGSKAMLSSIRITRKNEIRIFVYLIIFNIVVFFIGITSIYLLTGFIKWFMDSITNPLVSNYALTLSSYITYLLVILIMPINVIFVTNLFYYFTCQKEEPIDEVMLKSHPQLMKIENKVIQFFESRKYLFSFVVVIYLTIMFLFNYSYTEKIFNWDIVVAAHRGYHLAPENSISSIRESIELGVEVIEIDVQISKDGVLVLNHDRTLKRVAGKDERVADLNYSIIKDIYIGFKNSYLDEKIPTLEEALLEIDKKAKVIIDIKNYGSDQEMAEKIVELVERNNMIDDTYIQSFDQKILKEIRSINPEIKIGAILYASIGNLSLLDVDFYTIHQYMLSDAFVKNTHKLNREVWVWTVNLDENIREVLKYRVDGIITDYPERVHEILIE
jgi:glycerophosphoryl diester phosphodiesterase